jgi:hypothetical protein
LSGVGQCVGSGHVVPPLQAPRVGRLHSRQVHCHRVSQLITMGIVQQLSGGQPVFPRCEGQGKTGAAGSPHNEGDCGANTLRWLMAQACMLLCGLIDEVAIGEQRQALFWWPAVQARMHHVSCWARTQGGTTSPLFKRWPLAAHRDPQQLGEGGSNGSGKVTCQGTLAVRRV